MGSALVAALVLPVWAALAVFAGLGLGLALPFLLLGFVPVLRRILPRPGAWMRTFERVVSGPRFLTPLAFMWVLSCQTSKDGDQRGILWCLVMGSLRSGERLVGIGWVH